MSVGEYTIGQVQGPNEWSGTHGTFHDYKLLVHETDKPIIITQKPTSPPPQDGQSLFLELAPHPKFPDTFKGRRVPPPDQQQSFRNGTQQHGDRDESIERQSCVRSAAILYTGRDVAPVDVLATSDMFLQWVQQR